MSPVNVVVHLDDVHGFRCVELASGAARFVSLKLGDDVALFVRDADRLAELAAVVAQAGETLARWDTERAARQGVAA